MKSIVGLLALFLSNAGYAQGPSRPQLQAAAAHSIRLLQQVGADWKPDCLSCHHQVLPALALAAARSRGLPVDETVARKVASRSFAFLSSLDDAVQDPDIIDPALSEGNILLAAHASGVEPGLTTGVYAYRIAKFQLPDGHWPTLDGRPPQSASLFTSTAVGVRAVSLFLPQSLSPQKLAVQAGARRWLLSARPQNTEDLAFRLLGLAWSDTPAAERRPSVAGLLAAQRPDGGWGQLPGLDSDAYSTAESLVALRWSDTVPAADPRWQRGLQYLVRTQAADGSWLVRSRIHTPAPISPPYIETGFPYGHDQFLSCAATALAVMAIAEALPPAATPARPIPVVAAKPKDPAPWTETVLFGSTSELAAALDGGLDPNSATPGGTTLLMMSAHDPSKVKLLLDLGANAKALAKSGYDALMVASLYPGSAQSVRLLLDRGVDPKARTGVRYSASALPLATIAGDAQVVELLLTHGAEPERKMNLLGFAPNTPLLLAVSFEYREVMQTLVRLGAKVDAVDKDKMTSLSWAGANLKLVAARTLLELGADPNHLDRFGYTPLRHAQSILHYPPELATLLRTAPRRDTQ